MPRKLDWTEVAVDLSQDDGYVFLECLKSNKVVKSQTSSCGVCSYPFPHAMKYQLLACACVACKKAAPYAKCPWRGKILTCTRSGVMCIYETGDHFTTATPPKEGSLSIRQKEFCKELALQGLKPVRIRNSMRGKFGLSTETLPSLRNVQNCVNYYARTKLGNNDSYGEVARSIREKAFAGREGDTDSFTFAWRVDAEQKPIVGIGSDEDPFFVGITTKTLLRRMDRPPESFVFHMDATFKLNQVGYPVFVVGISDRARRFHLVALFIASQRIEEIYRMALASLRRIHRAVTNSHIRIRYVVGDAEVAQYNAFESVFRADCEYEYLMCFFHVMVKVQERMKTMNPDISSRVLRDVYDLHFCCSPLEFARLEKDILARWSASEETRLFAQYFETQWLRGNFYRWQCYYTESGYATTNNPVEQFNRKLKRDYTLRARLKMGVLLNQLSECCRNEASSETLFQDAVEATSALKRRAEQLARDRLLLELPASGADHLADLQRGCVVNVVAYPAPRFFVPAKARTEEYLAVTAQMGINYARMELQGQSQLGWQVDVGLQWCPCRYRFKFGVCVHLLFSLQQRGRLDLGGNRVLVDRNIGRKSGRNGKAGRPSLNQHALSLQ